MAKLKTYFTNMVKGFWALRTKVKKNSAEKLLTDTYEKYEDGYYTHICNIPLDNWLRCQAGDLSYCRKASSRSDGNLGADHHYWDMVYDSYIQEYGLNKAYKKMLETMRRKAIAELEYCITGDRTQLTLAEIEESQIKSMLDNRGTGMTIEKTLIHLSKWIGYWLETSRLTAQQYFDLLGEFENYNKINKPKNDGKKDK